jgi:hypothetical protein
MTPEEKEQAWAYQVEVCEQIKKEFPNAYFGNGFARRDFSKEHLADQERRSEAWERLKRDYPDAEFPSEVFNARRAEYGGCNAGGWHDILDAQRHALERRARRF